MIDHILRLLALAGVVATLGIIWLFVPRVDLGAVIVVVLAMAVYDLYVEPIVRERRKK